MPNVVFMHTDDTGRYLSPYGHPVETPRLRALAEGGVLFRNAFSAAPSCSPSRAALMTGQYPHQNGMLGISHLGFELENYDRHLVSYLGDREFNTVLAGQQHETPNIDSRAAVDRLGYDRVLDTDERFENDHSMTRQDRENTAAAARFVREDHDEPYFLSLGFRNTHRPFPSNHDIDPDYVSLPSSLPDTPEMREEVAAYHAAVRVVDDCVGTVLTALDDAGALEETVVLFTTDHGLPFPRMKSTLYDAGVGVSLIARFPDGYRRGEAIDALVSQVDLYPTLCEYLGVDVPPWTEGTSLLPLLRGETDSVRDTVFVEQNFHNVADPKRAVRTERYKLIRFYDEYEGFVPAGDGPATHDVPPERNLAVSATNWIPGTEEAPSEFVPVERGLHAPTDADEMLFDCYFDPEEHVNVADEPRYRTIRETLSARLDDWMARTDDPLCDGPLERPEGSKRAPIFDRSDE